MTRTSHHPHLLPLCSSVPVFFLCVCVYNSLTSSPVCIFHSDTELVPLSSLQPSNCVCGLDFVCTCIRMFGSWPLPSLCQWWLLPHMLLLTKNNYIIFDFILAFVSLYRPAVSLLCIEYLISGGNFQELILQVYDSFAIYLPAGTW